VAAAPAANAGLGASVAASEDGTRVASGAPLGDRVGVGTDSGLATVWTLDASAWTATDVNPPDHAAGERFGTSVAFASYGTSLVVGSPYDTVGGIAQRGSVAVFTRSGAGWVMHDRLAIAGGTAASRCGTAVAGLNDAVIVGAPKHTPPAGGTVRVFESPVQTLGWATTLEMLPDQNVVTDATLRAGIVATGLPWRVRDNASQIEMLLVPPGTFQMGCSASDGEDCNADENPIHEVAITSPFYLGRYEVTQDQWSTAMASNPSRFSAATTEVPAAQVPLRPVEQVSWTMIQGFNAETGLRLPTEAEWEYAYRAGTTTAFHSFAGHLNGTNDDSLLENIAWINSNSVGQTRPVGQKHGSILGFHDLSGNVWEWVNDWYSNTYYQTSPQSNPTGPLTGLSRVQRGGSWNNDSKWCRSSVRDPYSPDFAFDSIGFRAARNP
jgi:formylglycine-generating enzyme required for sulfatase activity